jgi:hypothetical protein
VSGRRPHFKLAEVKVVASSQDGIVLSRTRARIFFATPVEAIESAARMFAELREDAFVETKHQNPDICDIYVYEPDPPIAARVAGSDTLCRAWYVKFTLLPEEVLLVSFHPLEHPIRTARGKQVLP